MAVKSEDAIVIIYYPSSSFLAGFSTSSVPCRREREGGRPGVGTGKF
jgi:hypothetical protein